MEPLFFKAENAGYIPGAVEVSAHPLQWSRFFSKRKITLRLALDRRFRRRFNGAAFFQSGK